MNADDTFEVKFKDGDETKDVVVGRMIDGWVRVSMPIYIAFYNSVPSTPSPPPGKAMATQLVEIAAATLAERNSDTGRSRGGLERRLPLLGEEI